MKLKQTTQKGESDFGNEVEPQEGNRELKISISKTNMLNTCEETLMEQILLKENMQEALLKVMKNKGAPGVDGITTENIKDFLTKYYPSIKEKLRKGTYNPSPVRRVKIPKSNGGQRPLGIPTAAAPQDGLFFKNPCINWCTLVFFYSK